MTATIRNTALALALAMTAALPAMAAGNVQDTRIAPKAQVDRQTTGSIVPAGDAGCAPVFLRAGAERCAAPADGTRKSYPSAPVNPAFGF